MKRFKLFTLVLAMLTFVIAAPAQAVLQDMWADVYTWNGQQSLDGKPVLTKKTSNITYKVLAINTTTAETLYYYNTPAMTSLTNPVTAAVFASDTISKDRIQFSVDPTDATNDRYVDLLVIDLVGGFTAFVENFDKYTHTIVIDERYGIQHHGSIWFGAGSLSVQDTGIHFIAGSLIQDVRVEVVTAGSGLSVDIGILAAATGGDTDGFRANVLLTTTGWVADTGVITDGTTIDWTAASTYGALLYKAITGTDAVVSAGGRSYLGHIITSETSAGNLVYGQSTTDTTGGFIHYWFTRGR
jgi:hypothetical protein